MARRFGAADKARPPKNRLKTVSVQSLRREPAVLRRELREQRIVEPVVRVDDVDVVAGTDDPPESRLPAGDATDRVVLDVVDPRQKRRELQFGNDAVEARVERGLRQRNRIELG